MAEALKTRYLNINGQDYDFGGSSVTVDSSLSATSTNPVQNKVVKSELDAQKYEANLKWGGRSISADISPVDAGLSAWHGANRAAFCNPAGITVEYSTDAGATWQDYGLSDKQKVALTSIAGGQGFFCGMHNSTNSGNADDRLRITIDAYDSGFYTLLKKILINVSTNGSQKCKVLVERAFMSDVTKWNAMVTRDIGGWSGWNSLDLGSPAYGGSLPQTGNTRALRFTFSAEPSTNATYINSLSVGNILVFGTTWWQTNSNMARTGHLYDYDVDQNATFPGKVKASGGFEGALNGNASSATKATQDGDGNNIAQTYLKMTDTGVTYSFTE